MSARSRGKSGGDNDADLFQRTMSGVEPLKRKKALKPAAAVEMSAVTSEIEKRQSAPRRATPIAPAAPQKPEPPQLRADSFAGVDRRTVERMRRGKLAIDARLDLHGKYQDAAHTALNTFIAGSAASGCRMVLVITGKGAVSEGGGVLRRRLPDWLNQPACRPHVLAFAAARPEHGGAGAFYVLLRRQRVKIP